MSDKTETTGCEACGGTGFFDARHSDRFCPTCDGAGTDPNGNSPENPESSYERLKGEPIRGMQRLQAETIRAQMAEIERLRERVNGLEKLHASWADGSLAELTAERDAFRAAVDHLKGERDTLRSALEIAAARSDSQNESISYFEQESASHDAALAEVTTDRDTLRLEVQKLKDLSFEAQDRYAALEAERDELKIELAAAEKEVVHMRESNGRADDYSAKLERVIEAANVNAGAMVNLLIAMANAGLPMPKAVPLSPKEPHE